MDRAATCCFTGHRAEKLPWRYDEGDLRCRELKRTLADVLDTLYESGFRHFICGMAVGADMYFGEAVTALRERRPGVTLEGAVPFSGQEKRWPERSQARYYRLAEACDRLTVLSPAYTAGCMGARNRYMVDHSALLLAVYDGRPGGTKNTIRYAVSQGVTVMQLPVLRVGPEGR